MRLRIEKNRRTLAGFHGPAAAFAALVPKGCVAVDAGAHLGLYAYWIAQRAQIVHAFEPNPDMFNRLSASAGSRIRPHNLGLSDRAQEAILRVPLGAPGDASLSIHSEDERPYRETRVHLRTLDSFDLTSLGFLKVDVEGHEEEVIAGAAETISRGKPVVFMEIEERHNPGALDRITSQMREVFGYSRISYLQAGLFKPLDQFDIDRDQISLAADPMSDQYVNNFLFRS